ncbi:MAG: pilin [Patescibacteria group bacterium]
MSRKILIAFLFALIVLPIQAVRADSEVDQISGGTSTQDDFDAINEEIGYDTTTTTETPINVGNIPPNPSKLIGGSLLPGTDAGTQAVIEANSIGWFQNTFLRNLTNQLIGWTAALAVVFLVLGGYQYLTAIGNEEKIKSAHKTIIWSLVGLMLALFAFAIVQIIINIHFQTGALGYLEKTEDSWVAQKSLEPDFLQASINSSMNQVIPFAQTGWSGDPSIQDLPRGDLKQELVPVVTRMLIYGMAFVAFLVFFFAGVWMIVGWGEEASVKKAKQAIVWAITGLAVAALSYILVKGLLGINWNSSSFLWF